jgi:hypothetical protein
VRREEPKPVYSQDPETHDEEQEEELLRYEEPKTFPRMRYQELVEEEEEEIPLRRPQMQEKSRVQFPDEEIPVTRNQQSNTMSRNQYREEEEEEEEIEYYSNPYKEEEEEGRDGYYGYKYLKLIYF